MLVTPVTEYRHFNYIINNLAVGSAGAREEEEFKAIISMMPGNQIRQCSFDGRIFPPHTTNVFIIPIHDGEPGLKPWLKKGIRFIDENIEKGPVLVHCYAGISRSASMVVAYLMSKGRSFQEAMTLVYEQRRIIDPWHGFIKEIKEYFDLKS